MVANRLLGWSQYWKYSMKGLLGSYCILTFFAESIELCPVVCELTSEVLDAVECLLLFLGNQFLLGER